MRIGIDFDNTIVSYDALFHRIAFEKKLIPGQIPVNKIAVRDYLRSTDQEDQWTLMQGEVYGLRMHEAQAYPHAIEFMIQAKKAGHQLYIISHKTKNPFMGPPYDLHQAAKLWVNSHLIFENNSLFAPEHVFYELSKDKKIERARSLGCDVFIDDLPEILAMPGFPEHTKKILFDPELQHAKITQTVTTATSWEVIAQFLLTK
jgi:hypothetical protein